MPEYPPHSGNSASLLELAAGRMLTSTDPSKHLGELALIMDFEVSRSCYILADRIRKACHASGYIMDREINLATEEFMEDRIMDDDDEPEGLRLVQS